MFLLCSIVSDSVTSWTVVCLASMSMGFFRQEYWRRLPFPSPGNLPDTGIEPKVSCVSCIGKVYSLPAEPPGKPPPPKPIFIHSSKKKIIFQGMAYLISMATDFFSLMGKNELLNQLLNLCLVAQTLSFFIVFCTN